MRKLITLLLTAVTFGSVCAQTPKTEEDVYTYLKSNLLTLDKVEGIYKYASYTQKNNETPVRLPIAAINVAIVASGDATYSAYWITNGTRAVNQKSFMQIKRRDYLKIYEASFYESVPKEIEFIDENNFRVYKEKAKSKSDDGSTESNIYYFEKSFPSKDDIEKERARVEAANPRSAKCTGFILGKNMIVTNLHVVEKAKAIRIRGVKGNFGQSYNAIIKQIDKTNDLAILGFEDSTVKVACPITMNLKTLEAGNDIYVLGYPLTASTGEEVKLINGIVSSKSGFQGDITSYQITAAAQPGNVGGPVFDKKGALVGIVSYKREGAEGSVYSLKSPYLKNLVDILPVKVKLPATNVLAAKPLAEKVKTLSKFVYLVEVDY